MAMAPDQKEFVSTSDGSRLILRRRAKDILELGWEGDRPNAFARIRAAIPNSPDLNQYAGRFVNGELRIEWNLLVSEGSLLITTPAGWRIPIAEAAPDRFEVGPWVLEFERSEGQISGLALHRERLWRLVFERVDGNPE